MTSSGFSGVASSSNQFDPQRSMPQSGASRSVSPKTARRAARLCDLRKSGSVVESWYLSPKIDDGRVRYVCSAQVASAGAEGAFSADGERERVIVGWRPLGWGKEVKYVASSGRAWCRDGKENIVGSATH